MRYTKVLTTMGESRRVESVKSMLGGLARSAMSGLARGMSVLRKLVFRPFLLMLSSVFGNVSINIGVTNQVLIVQNETMVDDTVNVVLDVHELQDPWTVHDALEDHSEVEGLQYDQLPAGDLDIEGVGFERKELGDYVTSLTEGRLDEQVAKLGQRYEESYILVEGDMVQTNNPFKSNISGESVRGSMASITARDNGVNAVIPVSNGTLLVDVAVRLARKHLDETPERRFLRSPVDIQEPTVMRMFACIDGVGPSMAERLYEEYPTISKFVFHASENRLQEIDGIGEKLAKTIMSDTL